MLPNLNKANICLKSCTYITSRTDSDTSMDYLLILPWNIKTEIISQLKDIAGDKVKFVTAIPSLEIS